MLMILIIIESCPRHNLEVSFQYSLMMILKKMIHNSIKYSITIAEMELFKEMIILVFGGIVSSTMRLLSGKICLILDSVMI